MSDIEVYDFKTGKWLPFNIDKVPVFETAAFNMPVEDITVWCSCILKRKRLVSFIPFLYVRKLDCFFLHNGDYDLPNYATLGYTFKSISDIELHVQDYLCLT